MERISTSNRRLDTWKEIGAFFGRDERTVKRWEVTRGLPVHRVPGGGRANVYANTDEFVEWLKGKNVTVEADAVSNVVASLTARAEAVGGSETGGGSESGAKANDIVGAGSVLLAGNGQLSETGAVERRVGQRRIPEKGDGVLPASREARYIAIAIVILATLAIVGVERRFSSARVGAKKATAARVVDPEAEQFYLKGMYYFNKRTPETLNQAVDYFMQAVVRDPQYAEAYLGLANCYNLLREYTVMPASEAYPRAMAAAKRAIALDDSLSGAHSSLAFVDFYWSWDVAGAQHEFQRAIELDPKCVLAHHWYATFLMALGRLPESLQEIEKAQQLDPQSNAILADKGLILFHNGQKEQAVTLLKQIETAEPDFLSPHNYLAMIYFLRGDYAQYLAESRIAATLLHDELRLAIVRASEKGFASGGSRGMLNAMLKEQQTLHDNGKEAAYDLAATHAALGEKKEALDNLQDSYQKREPEMLSLRIDPWLDNLHDQARYREILAKIGLPPVQ